MYKNGKIMTIVVNSPLHVGAGRSFGIVDMPIQRERHTQFPKIEGSSIKGALRSYFERNNITNTNKLFGSGDSGGLLAFTDARILLFPVKSMKGLFAWVTSPSVLHRFKKDLEIVGHTSIPDIPEENTVTNNSENIVNNEQVILEEYTFNVKKDGTTTKFAKWLSKRIFPNDEYAIDRLRKNLVIISDDDFRDFVTMSTEVITRINIDPVKNTVKSGGLFTEEQLPTETVLYSIVAELVVAQNEINAFDIFEKNIQNNKIMQFGGDNTLGKGFVTLNLFSGGAEPNEQKYKSN